MLVGVPLEKRLPSYVATVRGDHGMVRGGEKEKEAPEDDGICRVAGRGGGGGEGGDGGDY